MIKVFSYWPVLLLVTGISCFLGFSTDLRIGISFGILLLVILPFALAGFDARASETPPKNGATNPTEPSPANIPLPEILDAVRQEIRDQLILQVSARVKSVSSESQPLAFTVNDDLKSAVSTLAKELAVREKETQSLFEIIISKAQRNALARLATIRETAEFTRRINNAGKINDKEALNQLILEIEAAISDLGMEILHITAGSRIAELPNGSFNILTAVPPESPATAGTVKESLSDAVFIKDDSGKAIFIAPAKLRVYKL